MEDAAGTGPRARPWRAAPGGRWPARVAGTAKRLLFRPRRPAGEPTFAHHLDRTARPWLVALLVTVAWVWLPGLGARGTVAKLDAAVLRWSVRHFGAVRDAMPTMSAAGALRLVGWSVIVALAATRQWRRLAVFVGVVQLTLLTTMADKLATPRPYGTSYVARIAGDALPSWPVAGVAVTTVGAAYALLVAGPWRRRGLALATVLTAAFAAARVLLAYDRASAAVVGAVFGASLATVAFDMFVPDALFPVRLSGPPAHLDIEARKENIARALREQMRLRLADLRTFNLEGSAGSTPLLLALDAPAPPRLFAKLYSTSHLRSDRAYKVVRAIRYGALEDEAPFANVRSLVQREDYLLRVMRDAGVRVPRTCGVLEVVPEREYLLVTEFLDRAVELTEAEVDDAAIDDALMQVRLMWSAGVAHRDVKPSNLLLRDGEVWFIDLAFGEVRPSAWRRSVDLANTMLVLALRTDSRRVLERALRTFSEEEIAEAFAATHPVTVPSQLRALLRADERDLLAEFRDALPPLPHVRLQRWTVHRLRITAATLLVVVAGAAAVWLNFNATGWL